MLAALLVLVMVASVLTDIPILSGKSVAQAKVKGIDNLAITITKPATGKTPATTAKVSAAGVKVEKVEWDPGDKTFRDGRCYTAIITLKVTDMTKRFVDYLYDYWRTPASIDNVLKYAPKVTVNGNAPGVSVLSQSLDNTQLVIKYTFAPAGATAMEWEQLKLTNRTRMKVKALPVSVFPKLQSAARKRAVEQGKRYGHTRPNGTSFATIFDEYGLTASWKAENAAKNYPTPEKVTQGWIDSPGHYRNMINAKAKHMANGCAWNLNSTVRIGWIQLFSRCGDLKATGIAGYKKNDTFAGGTSIDDMNYSLKLKCSHGVSYLPLIKEMCSGYDPNKTGTQKITVKYNNKKVATLTVKVNNTVDLSKQESASGFFCSDSIVSDVGVKLYAQASTSSDVIATFPVNQKLMMLDGIMVRTDFLRANYHGRIVYVERAKIAKVKWYTWDGYTDKTDQNAAYTNATVKLAAGTDYAIAYHGSKLLDSGIGTFMNGEKVKVLDQNVSADVVSIDLSGYLAYMKKSELSFE